MNQHNYVAIMAGGIGSRFWPSSRISYPKQFLDVLNTGKSLIRWTYERYAAFIPAENIFIVTSEEYIAIVEEQLPELNKENIIAEPFRKNTAPCVAYISFKILQIDPDALMIVAPSDHIILDQAHFEMVTLRALAFAGKTDALVTLGIKPTHPNTGYGYIQHALSPVQSDVFKVKTFTEKPNLELAMTFLKSGDFLWNGGIFVWSVRTIVKAFQDHQPEMFELFDHEQANFNTEKEKESVKRIYSLCTNVSIDFAIMEKSDNVYVIPSAFGWSDLGTWNSAYDNIDKDLLGNAIAGDNVVVINSTNCMISAEAYPFIEITVVSDAIDLMKLVNKKKWDVIITDISMPPGESGLEAVKKIRDIAPKTPVIVLSMHAAEQYAVRAIKAGASGYLTKNGATLELIKAVNHVMSGAKYVSPEVAHLLADAFEDSNKGGSIDSLSDREFEVFNLLASAKTISEIAKQLVVSVNTVSTFRSRIFAKMHFLNNMELMKYAVEHNLV